MKATILNGDAREVVKTLADKSIQCCVTSPPYYGLRDYGTARWEGGDPACDHKHKQKRTSRGGPKSTLTGGQNQDAHQAQYRGSCEKCGAKRIDHQIGLEDTPALYIKALVDGVFAPLLAKMRDDGCLWIVIGDSYASTWSCGRRNTVGDGACDYGSRQVRTGNGIKEKDLIGIPWMLAFALRDAGWYLRSEIIWEKPSCMPDSTKDRPTRSHEQVFFLTKSARYFYDGEAIKEPLAEGSIKRLIQPNLASQNGSDRAHAGVKSNGNMKAVGGSKGSFGPQQSRRRSGNKERKFRADNGGNPDSDSNMGYAIPWEDDGSGRNKRTIWRVASTIRSGGYVAKCASLYGFAGGSPAVPFDERGPHFRNSQGTSHSDREGLTQSSYRTTGFAPTCKCESQGSARSIVLDPFCGSGTTGLVCSRLERDFIGIELKPAYVKMSERRIRDDAPLFDVLGEHAVSGAHGATGALLKDEP